MQKEEYGLQVSTLGTLWPLSMNFEDIFEMDSHVMIAKATKYHHYDSKFTLTKMKNLLIN